MDKELLIEIIKILPTLLLYVVILIVFLRYRKPFVEGILPKISGFKAFGFEASFTFLYRFPNRRAGNSPTFAQLFRKI